MRSLALLALGLFSACAHTSPSADRELLHLREGIGLHYARSLAEHPQFLIAELIVDGERTAAVDLRLSSGRGGAGVIDSLPQEQAARIASAVRGGLTLSAALEEERAIPDGFDRWPKEVRSFGRTKLSGWSLMVKIQEDPPFGLGWAAILKEQTLAGEGSASGGSVGPAPGGVLPSAGREAPVRTRAEGPNEVIPWRSASHEVVSVATVDDVLLVGVEQRDGALRTRDVEMIDLRKAAAQLLAAQAAWALDRGEPWRAEAALERARELDAPVPEYWFQLARLAAHAADRDGLLHALEQAIASEPTYWRMEARIHLDFAPWLQDRGFASLTGPRPLPGSDRAGTRSSSAPSSAPPEPLPEERGPPQPAEKPDSDEGGEGDEKPRPPPPIVLPPSG